MALRAGVDLVDMEFVQYYPVVLRWPVTHMLASPTLFPLGAKLYNKLGERFMAHLPQGTENVTRDIRSRAIFREIVAGRGINDDAVIMSLADIDEAAFRRYAPDMAHIVDVQQLDYRTAQFLVRPEAHFFCGGVRTDAWGATALAGLYAVGEVAGGCHGANRLANNAFPECYVFGKRAGEHAATNVSPVSPASLTTLAQASAPHGAAYHAKHRRPRALQNRAESVTATDVGACRGDPAHQNALPGVRDIAGIRNPGTGRHGDRPRYSGTLPRIG